jgi:hypothetical protein
MAISVLLVQVVLQAMDELEGAFVMDEHVPDASVFCTLRRALESACAAAMRFERETDARSEVQRRKDERERHFDGAITRSGAVCHSLCMNMKVMRTLLSGSSVPKVRRKSVCCDGES